MNATFECRCDGKTTVVSETVVRHACLRASQSYGFDNVECAYERVQIDPSLTKGAVRYNWFRRWNRA